MRLVDSDKLRTKCIEISKENEECSSSVSKAAVATLKLVIKLIDNAPTAEAVPVVRCKDCVYAEKGQTTDGRVWCFYFDSVMNDTGFCSRGERK